MKIYSRESCSGAVSIWVVKCSAQQMFTPDDEDSEFQAHRCARFIGHITIDKSPV